MVLLDHLTRGRTMLGVGPGQLTSDAHMLGIPADAQRPRMEESLDAIMALLRGETVTMETDGFILRDARLQLAPYSDPCFDIAVAASFSPTGARAAGKHGIGMLSVAATAKQGMDLLGHHWNLWEEIALENGHVADRSKWRLVGPMHLAETREQAEKEVEYGIARVLAVLHPRAPGRPGPGRHARRRSSRTTRRPGFAVIGTPDDAIAKIEELVESSNGGFGAFLLLRPRLGDARGDAAVGRAVRPVRDAEVPGSARRAGGVVRLGHRAAAASSSAGPPTRSPRRSRTTRPSAAAE